MIYAGVNGYLDKFEVARVRAFEGGLLTLVRTKHAGLLNSIRKSGDLSKDDEAKASHSVLMAVESRYRRARVWLSRRWSHANRLAISFPSRRLGFARSPYEPANHAWPGPLSRARAFVVWDVNRRERIRELEGRSNSILALAYGPPARPDLLAAAGADGKVCIWEPDDGPPLRVLVGHLGEVEDLAFLPDGRTLVTAGADGTARLWDVDSGIPLQAPLDCKSGPIQALSVSPDGRRVAMAGGDESVLVWDVKSNSQKVRRLKLAGNPNSVAFSPDGSWIGASGSTPGSGGVVTVWNAASGSVLSQWNSSSAIRSLIFSPDGRRIVTGAADGTLVVWDFVTGRETLALEGHRKPVFTLVSAQPIQIFSAGLDGKVKLWSGLAPAATSRAPSRSRRQQRVPGALRSLTNASGPGRFVSASTGPNLQDLHRSGLSTFAKHPHGLLAQLCTNLWQCRG